MSEFSETQFGDAPTEPEVTPAIPDHEDARREFEKVETPEDLLSFLGAHVAYGFRGKNGKTYNPQDAGWDTDFGTEYGLQSPEELLASGHGVCWDTAELERRWFTDHGYNPETVFLLYAKKEDNELPTHTFVTYKKDEMWHWFEHSFGAHRGIHDYPTREALIADVAKKHHDYALRHRGATAEDEGDIRYLTYAQPPFGSTPQEYISNIFQQHPEINTEPRP